MIVRFLITLGLFSLGLVCLTAPAPALGLTITAPAAQAVVQPGQAISVAVDLGDEISVSTVEFYWYREGEEPRSSHQVRASLIATSRSEPPFGGKLVVPDDAIGTMRLMAVGEVASGRMAGRQEFDEILLSAEPMSDLVGIDFEVEKPWRLRAIGSVLKTPVVGDFADGVVRALGGAAAGSTYRSSDERVVKVFPSGLVRTVGAGEATLTVKNRGLTGTLGVVVQASPQQNEWPVADAGEDLTVRSGKTVALNGFESFDPDGDPLRYRWTQTRGNKVSLIDHDSPRPRFVAPKVSRKRLLRFELQVSDMAGADTLKGADSLPAVVNVWVIP